jgi:hypothetical protein
MKELSALIEAFSSLPTLDSSAIEYRLYYDESGAPTAMSSADHPAFGKYILIDKKIYDQANYSELRVVNGELKILKQTSTHHHALVLGGRRFKTVKGHANILVDADYHGEISYYDFKNH